jgi:hypothetical protein
MKTAMSTFTKSPSRAPRAFQEKTAPNTAATAMNSARGSQRGGCGESGAPGGGSGWSGGGSVPPASDELGDVMPRP